MKLVTSDQMRTLERRAQNAGAPLDDLMERAGLEIARSVRRHLGRVVGAHVLALIGKGSNGGDGLVAARRLISWGARAAVCIVGERPEDDPKLRLVLRQGAPVIHAGRDDWIPRLRDALAHSDIAIDSLLGTGRSRPIEGLMKQALRELSAQKASRPRLQVLAVDAPSGLDADTGALDPAAAPADLTITLGYPKAGLYAFPGADAVGRVEIADIGIPENLDDDLPIELAAPDWAAERLPARPTSAHKGTFGRVMIVAGSRSYVGAASLAARAAGRAGAGLVTLAAPESLRASIAPLAAEATHLPLDEAGPGIHSLRAAAQILDEIDSCDALLVGCGLGQARETQAMLRELIMSGRALPPTLIDADALNFLARQREWWTEMDAPAVLTPHPGEMARLTKLAAADVQRDRTTAALEAAKRWNCVVALKGAFTITAAPDGTAVVSPFANPALASAGTGDVLAGVIAALLAQKLTPKDAAALGVYVHAAAAEIVRAAILGEGPDGGRAGNSGLLAADLLPALPKAISRLTPPHSPHG